MRAMTSLSLNGTAQTFLGFQPIFLKLPQSNLVLDRNRKQGFLGE